MQKSFKKLLLLPSIDGSKLTKILKIDCAWKRRHKLALYGYLYDLDSHYTSSVTLATKTGATNMGGAFFFTKIASLFRKLIQWYQCNMHINRCEVSIQHPFHLSLSRYIFGKFTILNQNCLYGKLDLCKFKMRRKVIVQFNFSMLIITLEFFTACIVRVNLKTE